MVTVALSLETAREAASSVLDPELPVLTLADLGVLRDVTIDPAGAVTVTVTPTYSGCPAMEVIERDVADAVRAVGFSDVQVRRVLSPAWTTDAMTEQGKARLEAYGVAPPGPATRAAAGPVSLTLSVRCPRCSSVDTEELSRFGSTACKALWRCRSCREPFDRFKSL